MTEPRIPEPGGAAPSRLSRPLGSPLPGAREGAEALGADLRPHDGELRAALSELLADGAEPVRIVERRAMASRSTLPLEELRLRRPDGSDLALVFKDSSGLRHAAEQRGGRAPFVVDPQREIDTYRDVLFPHGVSAPAFVGAITAAKRDRYWLFLEKVDGVELWQGGGIVSFARAAEWLAKFHARFDGETSDLPRRLLARTGEHYRRWLARAERFAPGAALDRVRLRRRLAAAIQWLDAARPTFLHGEFYPSNVLLESPSLAPRIRPVDWEMAGVGPGLLDLAALVSGDWRDDERDGLARVYRDALPRRLRPSVERLRIELEHARFLVAVQWLGWSSDWTPPPHHDCDWLATARALVARPS